MCTYKEQMLRCNFSDSDRNQFDIYCHCYHSACILIFFSTKTPKLCLFPTHFFIGLLSKSTQNDKGKFINNVNFICMSFNTLMISVPEAQHNGKNCTCLHTKYSNKLDNSSQCLLKIRNLSTFHHIYKQHLTREGFAPISLVILFKLVEY